MIISCNLRRNNKTVETTLFATQPDLEKYLLSIGLNITAGLTLERTVHTSWTDEHNDICAVWIQKHEIDSKELIFDSFVLYLGDDLDIPVADENCSFGAIIRQAKQLSIEKGKRIWIFRKDGEDEDLVWWTDPEAPQ